MVSTLDYYAALHKAVLMNRHEVIQIFLGNYANWCKLKGRIYNTALHIACIASHQETALTILNCMLSDSNGSVYHEMINSQNAESRVIETANTELVNPLFIVTMSVANMLQLRTSAKFGALECSATIRLQK